MLTFRKTPKNTTKKSIFIITTTLLLTLLFPVSAASAATTGGTTSAATTTVSAVTTAATVPLTAAQKKAAAKAKAKAHKAAVKAKKKAKAKRERAKIIKMAKKYRGYRYTFGGASPSTGFDCSGFTQYVFKKSVHVNLPHSANAQSFRGRKVSAKNAKPGDLVVYSLPGNRNFHVAVYLSKTKIIHAKGYGTNTKIGPLAWGNTTRTFIDIVDPHVGL